MDTRYANGKVCSHDKQGIEASFACHTLNDLYQNADTIEQFIHSEIIVVEEAQFFGDLLEFVKKTVDEEQKHLIIVGLDGDVNRKPFGSILDCVPLADSVLRLSSLCEVCADGTDAHFTGLRSHCQIIHDLGKPDIGATEKYLPLCRFHYLENRTHSNTNESFNTV